MMHRITFAILLLVLVGVPRVASASLDRLTGTDSTPR
jgi:hypothetical protein